MRFSDPGTLLKDGSISVTVSPDSRDTFFDLYVVNRRKDGKYSDTNVDMYDDWDHLTFRYNPSNAVGITMDGLLLDVQTIGYFYDYILFSSPIHLIQLHPHAALVYTGKARRQEAGPLFQGEGSQDRMRAHAHAA